MELVFVRKEGDNFLPAEYGGADVGVGGEQYPVKKVGSRYLVNVPDRLGWLLESHGWISTGMATSEMVEVAAQQAFRDNAADKAAAKK